MSGHSKWAGIKNKKALIDAKRGKLFSRLTKDITVAAKHGGGNPDANPTLRSVLLKAKESNMPHDNIERAIKRGTGELPGVVYEEVVYEGYAPGGVAVMVDVTTDNKNRTSAEIRNMFSKRGGNLAGTGSVNWLFHKKGFILVDKKVMDEDRLMSIVLESGAEDLKTEGDTYEVITDPKDFEKIKAKLQENNIPYQAAEITMLPQTTVKIDKGLAKQVLGLVEALEELDDVQNVYANFDIPDEVLAEA